MMETERHLAVVQDYCHGFGADVGFGGAPIRPDAMTIDTRPETQPGVLRDGRDLSFLPDGVLDYVYSSHLLEDFLDWDPVLAEWCRVLRPGGALVLLLPDRQRFRANVRDGANGENLDHRHEAYPGEVSEHILRMGLPLDVVRDELVAPADPRDYNIVIVAMRRGGG